MRKTTLYLPDDLKERIEHEAAAEGTSEAELIRRILELGVRSARPRPRGGLFRSGEPFASKVDELLEGFGDHR